MDEEEALKRMSKLTQWLLSRPDALPFAEPVDWRALELFDYPKIVRKPMDLGTVKRKLDKHQYEDIEECAQDIRLIWNNCKTYNADGSDFYLLAESLSKRFEERYSKILADYDASFGTPSNTSSGYADGSSSHSKNSTRKKRGGKQGGEEEKKNAASASSSTDANLDVKMSFASKLFQLSGMDLGHVLKIIDLKCPQALESPDLGSSHKDDIPSNAGVCRVEINVDKIDPRTFMELDRYVKDKFMQRSSEEEMEFGDTPPSRKRPK